MAEDYKVWTRDYSIDKLIIQIHILYLANPNLITGDILGILAKRLISSELEIGGPYLSKNDLYTNTLIAQLFRTFDSPLPNLEKFLLNQKLIPKTEFQRSALGLSKRTNHNDHKKSKINRPYLIAKKEIKKLNPTIEKIGIAFLDKIISVDKRSEISLLSFYFVNSLVKCPTKSDLELSYHLGVANIYAWIAYTIYDDFIDEEGSPPQLSLANIMHRLSYQAYTQKFSAQTDFINLHYDSVDNSNLWELENCRFIVKDGYIFIDNPPDYGDGDFLAQRSVGHVLGPKLLLKLNKTPIAQEKSLNDALNKYLIARQIGDDVKDWKEDLKNGHINYVVSKLLRSARVQKGQQELDELTENLQRIFWNSILEESLLEIIDNIDSAENILLNSNLLKKENDFIQNVLDPLREIAKLDLKKHLNDKEFLKSYSSS
ncbi:MAG: hypothetical protein JWO99_500 [Candidatus Saccharibacteria bacterium]|nr:hypothetical protein [Candidatus Saccharibacteria bacterium]